MSPNRIRRARYAAVVFAILLATSIGLAAPPVEVPATVEGEPGDFIALRAKTDGQVVRFVMLDPGLKQFPQDLLSDKKAAVFTATKPGSYRVLVYSSVKNEPTDPALVTVIVGKGKPQPGPEPTPEPDPVQPTAKKIVVVVVEETRNRTPAQGKILFDQGVRDWLKQSGHQIELFDKDDPKTKASGYIPYVDRTGLPTVLVFDASSDGPVVPLKVFKLPDTAQAFRAALESAVKK